MHLRTHDIVILAWPDGFKYTIPPIPVQPRQTLRDGQYPDANHSSPLNIVDALALRRQGDSRGRAQKVNEGRGASFPRGKTNAGGKGEMGDLSGSVGVLEQMLAPLPVSQSKQMEIRDTLDSLYGICYQSPPSIPQNLDPLSFSPRLVPALDRLPPALPRQQGRPESLLVECVDVADGGGIHGGDAQDQREKGDDGIFD